MKKLKFTSVFYLLAFLFITSVGYSQRMVAANEITPQFLKETFDNRKFISEKLLNKKLKERFGASTWYRKRMIDLNLISSKNKIIKPAKEVIEN